MLDVTENKSAAARSSADSKHVWVCHLYGDCLLSVSLNDVEDVRHGCSLDAVRVCCSVGLTPEEIYRNLKPSTGQPKKLHVLISDVNVLSYPIDIYNNTVALL